ncbi:MAG: hypothetical protein QW057_04460 [Candidatus Bathyarchaeia archaeon]
MKASRKVLVAILLLTLTPLLVGSVTLAKPSQGNGNPHGEDGDGRGNGKPPKVVPASQSASLASMNISVRIVNGTAYNATNRSDVYRFNATINGTIEKVSKGRWKAPVLMTQVSEANFTILGSAGDSATYEFAKGLIILPMRSGKIHIWAAMNTRTGDTAKLILHGRLNLSDEMPRSPENMTVPVDFLAPQSKLVRGIAQPAYFLEALNGDEDVISELTITVAED